jgi:uncharacterized protein YndB with AHSA1/START domain
MCAAKSENERNEAVMNDPIPTLLIERLVPAPPRTVFEAWLDAEALRRFMCPTPGSSVTHVECDARVGGTFLIVMNVGGQDLPHHGEYLEIERHTRLVFTWRSHTAGEGSRVTLRFAESADGQTRLTLEHVGLADPEVRASHHDGWSHILTMVAMLDGLAA